MFCCSGVKERIGKYAGRTCLDEGKRWLMHEIHLVRHSNSSLYKVILSIVLRSGYSVFVFVFFYFCRSSESAVVLLQK